METIKREFMNAADKPQAGTVSDASPELMPSLGSYKMPARTKEIVAADEKNNKTEKLLQFDWPLSALGVLAIRILSTLHSGSFHIRFAN